MKPTSDDELRERFAELRAADREHAPDFHALWSLAREHAPLVTSSRRPGLITILAAAGFILATGVVFRSMHDAVAPDAIADSARPGLDSPPRIETWRSPTAGFLRAPGDELLHALPTIESSILDGAAPPSTQRKGD